MARARTPTPSDELAEVDARIDAAVKEGEDWSAKRGAAEAAVRSYPDRLDEALKLRRLPGGEMVKLPNEAEPARLKGFVADAKREENSIRAAKPLLEEERDKFLAAALPYFDAEAEEAARELEAECEAFLAHRDVLMAKQAAKEQAWRRSRDGRRQLKVEQIPPVGFNDLGDVPVKVEDVKSKAWPGESEQRWREFKAREDRGTGARFTSTAEAVAAFAGEAA